jgi:hypothetical protein
VATDQEIHDALTDGLVKAVQTGVSRYRIQQREVQRFSPSELLAAQKSLAWQAARAAGTPLFIPVQPEPAD